MADRESAGRGRRLELGTWIVPAPTRDAEETVEAERLGFDIALFGDSQTVFEDPYVRMAFAAGRTSRIVLAPGVAAPLIRDASVTAACAATVHMESGGRALLCLGSGDSALAATGRRPPLALADFEREIRLVRAYLRGEEVERNGTRSRLHWLTRELPAVEVDVSATGPRTIATAARAADRVTFNVGAAPDRIAWASELACAERSEVRRGAWITIAVGDDERELIDGIRAACTVHARFPAMGAAREDALPAHARAVAAAVDRELARPSRETRVAALRRATMHVDDDFVRWHAIVGRPEQAIEQLRAVLDCGLEHLYLVFGDPNTDSAFMRASRRRFAEEVMPALRELPSSAARRAREVPAAPA